MKRIQRRSFLKQLAFGGSESDLSKARLEPGALRRAEPQTLICIFLRGGADTLNMVIPYADDQYYKVRPSLAIAAPSLSKPGASLRITDHYAFHPKMRPLLPIFKDGRMAVVQGVGTDNTSGSHFEAQDQVEHGESEGRKLNGGWLGRYLRSCGSAGTPLSAVAIGHSLPEALRGAPCASALSSLDEVELKMPPEDKANVTAALSKLYSSDIDMLGRAGKSTIDLLSRVAKLQKSHYRPAPGSVYPDSEFGSSLKEVARLIKADVGLEVACIDHNNWDTHFFQGSA